MGPAVTEDCGANIGAVATRGERGTLVVSMDGSIRMLPIPCSSRVLERIKVRIGGDPRGTKAKMAE
jgi:hypothetical protein